MEMLISRIVNKHIFNRLVYIVAAVLLITFLILTCISFSIPYLIQETIVTNNIEQTCDIGYSAEVVACTLYPKGGIIKPEGILMGSIAKYLVFDVEALVQSDRPVDISGTSRVNAILVADRLWEREFPLSRQTNVNATGEHNVLISGTFRLDVNKIFKFIDQVEKETQIPPNKYVLRIRPEIEGLIISDEFRTELAPVPDVIFEISGKKLIQVSESGDEIFSQDDMEAFSVKTPVTQSNSIMQNIILAGIAIPVLSVRYILCGLTFALACFWLFIFMRAHVKRAQPSEEEKIEKKYGHSIYPLNLQMQSLGKQTLELGSFARLLKLSEDRELPIFKANGDEKTPYYLLIDADYVYFFAAQTNHASSADAVQDMSSEKLEAGLE